MSSENEEDTPLSSQIDSPVKKISGSAAPFAEESEGEDVEMRDAVTSKAIGPRSSALQADEDSDADVVPRAKII